MNAFEQPQENENQEKLSIVEQLEHKQQAKAHEGMPDEELLSMIVDLYPIEAPPDDYPLEYSAVKITEQFAEEGVSAEVHDTTLYISRNGRQIYPIEKQQ